MIARAGLAALSLLLGLQRDGLAQVVRARAIDESTRGAVAGALLSLRTPAGARVVQALTDDGGRAVLRAPAPGGYLLRADRIGFEGTTAGPFTVAGTDTVAITVTMPARRVMLPDLSVTSAKPVCRIEQESGTQMATVWEEARKALTGTVLTRAVRPPILEVTTFERDLDRNGLIKAERSAVRRQAGSQPFAAADPDRLIERGFVEHRDGETWYFGPDAHLLLSDPFLAVHCFKLVRGETPDTALVGLAFEPARGRDVPEVKGTLWLDRASSELRFLEFSFVNVDRAVATGREGGRIEFARLPTGGWIVSDWSIRMPIVVRFRRRGELVDQWSGRDSLIGIREQGGRAVLVEAAPPARNRAVLEGTVYDSARGEPLESVVVTIGGGGYVDTTDQSGRYRIETPTQGPFVVGFDHPRFILLGLAPKTGAASLERGRVATLDAAIPPVERLRPALCAGRDVDPESPTALAGFIRDSAGRPAPRTGVDLSWARYGRAGPAIAEARRRAEVVSDEQGGYRICGLPASTGIVVLGGEGFAAVPGSIRLASDSLVVADITLVPRHRVPARSAVRIAVRSTATGRPVPEALVTGAGGDSVRTGGDGTALIGPLRPGRHLIEVRALGFEPGREQVVVGDRDTASVNLGLAPVAVTLSEIEVTAERVRRDARLAGFEERRTSGLGHYLTRGQLALREHSSLADVLRMSPGARLVPLPPPCTGYAAANGRDNTGIAPFRCGSRPLPRACYLAVWVDGLRVWDYSSREPPPNLEQYGVHTLEGVEIYVGAAQIPAQYHSAGAHCGAVLLWTRA